MSLHAYFEEWTLRPGDKARLAVSTEQSDVRAVLLRFVGGPGARNDRRIAAEILDRHLDVTFPGRVQETVVGSYAALPLSEPLPDEFSIHCWVMPTMPQSDAVQTVWSLGTIALEVVDGKLSLNAAGARAVADRELVSRRWYSVVVSIAGGRAVLDVRQSRGFRLEMAARTETGLTETSKLTGASELLLAASEVTPGGAPVAPFNGKIDSPRIYSPCLNDAELARAATGVDAREKALVAWTVGPDWDSTELKPLYGTAASGRLVNGVEKAVTGRNWSGESESFLERPEEYQALQFHEDDVVDAGWEYDLEFRLPDGLGSGVYAVRLEDGKETVHVPFFLAAPRAESATVLFLAPTNTYLAYANDHLAAFDLSACMPHEKDIDPEVAELFERADLGRSVYDTHSDGTPVRYASRRRSLVTLRPASRSWITDSYRHFPNDLYYIDWLESAGLPYHVATDELIEDEGIELLRKYKVVVTGSHPEYWSDDALRSMEQYLETGGKLMYLGGNGFYWVTTRFKDRPWVIEVRRDNTGTRGWDAPYGERRHASTTELGGIWRLRGRAPNTIAGIGFTAEGWGAASSYKRLPASYEGEGARFFKGVEDETFGEQGYVLGGAVADEVDRFDLQLGSPAHAEILATSTPLGREYQLAIEEQTLMLPDQDGVNRPDVVRSDVVYFRTAGGGEVFSAGSIAYAGALAWNDCDNTLARITTNVLHDFAGHSSD